MYWHNLAFCTLVKTLWDTILLLVFCTLLEQTSPSASSSKGSTWITFHQFCYKSSPIPHRNSQATIIHNIMLLFTHLLWRSKNLTQTVFTSHFTLWTFQFLMLFHQHTGHPSATCWAGLRSVRAVLFMLCLLTEMPHQHCYKSTHLFAVFYAEQDHKLPKKWLKKKKKQMRENSNSKTLFYKDCSLGSFKNFF